MSDSLLNQLIQQTPFLSLGDKSFLISKVSNMTALEKLKLKQSLQAGQAPAILQNLHTMRAKFFQDESPKKPDPLTQFVQKIIPPKNKEIVSHSILSSTGILGGPIPKAISTQGVPAAPTLIDIRHPAQLSMLTPQHITFSINDNIDQIMIQTLQNLQKLFLSVDDIFMRRNFYMNYAQSPLFKSYLNTGITALKHKELKPRKISLNLLFQIDSRYLNNRQFQHAAVLSNHMRELSGL